MSQFRTLITAKANQYGGFSGFRNSTSNASLGFIFIIIFNHTVHYVFHSVNIGNDILMRELLLLLHSSTTVMEQHVSNMCPYRPQGQSVYTNISRAVIVNEKNKINKYSSRASRITNKFLLSFSFCLSQYILFRVTLSRYFASQTSQTPDLKLLFRYSWNKRPDFLNIS